MKTSRRLAILGITAIAVTAIVAWQGLNPDSAGPTSADGEASAGNWSGVGKVGPSPRAWRLREHKEELPEISLTAPDIERRTQFRKPTGEEANWAKIGWRDSMWDAILEARKTDKPLLVWSMNGHPQGFT